MALTSNVDSGFEAAVLDAAAVIGASDPRELLVILFAESSVTPTADLHLVNKHGVLTSRFVGINQFHVSVTGGPDTFTKAVPGLSPDTYLTLPASVQLRHYVLPFWAALRQQHGPDATANARNLYWVNFLPATFVPDAPDSHVITSDPSVIDANQLIAHGKSYITAGDLSRFLLFRQKAESHRWNELLDRVEAKMGLRPDVLGTLFNPAPLPRAGIGLGFFLAAGAGAAYLFTRRSS
jgi:hypothetical protein